MMRASRIAPVFRFFVGQGFQSKCNLESWVGEKYESMLKSTSSLNVVLPIFLVQKIASADDCYAPLYEANRTFIEF